MLNQEQMDTLLTDAEAINDSDYYPLPSPSVAKEGVVVLLDTGTSQEKAVYNALTEQAARKWVNKNMQRELGFRAIDIVEVQPGLEYVIEEWS